MTKANECTCPSGDGSLAHPCPAHPAPVEQAGGDERAVDGKPRATRCPDCGESDLMPGDLCTCGYETDPAAGYACSECDGSGDGCVGEVCRECDGTGWFVTPEQARAALAQPSGEVVVTKNESGAIVSVTRQDKEGRLLSVIAESQPSPAQAEKAEAERPIVSFEKYMQVMYDRDENAKRLDAGLAEVERLRQFERICEGLPQDAIDGGWTVQGIRAHSKQLEEQLKVALARVAELEKQDLVDVPGPDEIHQMAFEEGRPADDGDGYLFSAEEFDLFVQRLLDSCAAPVAQDQQLHDLDKQCRDDVGRALGLRPSQERGFAWSYLLASIKSCVKAAEDTDQAQHGVPEGWVQSLPLKDHQPCKPNEDRANGYTIPIYSRPVLVDEALRKLRAVLCDPIGNVVIDGSDGDREEVQRALGLLAAAPGKEGV